MSFLRTGMIIRHYKSGTFYQILLSGCHEATEEPMIAYSSLHLVPPHNVFFRNASEFTDLIQVGSTTVPRFRLATVKELETQLFWRESMEQVNPFKPLPSK